MARITPRLDAFFRNAGKGGVSAVDVGFFSTARYPDGRYVAQIAAVHEFGAPARGIPSRPFFRRAIASAGQELRMIARQRVKPETMTVDRRTADLLGSRMQSEIQTGIRTLRTPPNAPATIRRKGSSNPLIDTGTMRTAVSWKVYGGPGAAQS